MTLLERYYNKDNTADVTLYYYDDSADYVITAHWTNYRHFLGVGEKRVKHTQEESTDDYRVAKALFKEWKRYIDL